MIRVVRLRSVLTGLIGVIALAVPLSGGAEKDAAPRLKSSTTRYGQIPIHFEVNRGQADARVQYLSRGPGYTAFFTTTETILRLRNTALHISLVDAASQPVVVGEGEMHGRVNYLKGQPSAWQTQVPTYARVLYRGVYPGIDLAYYGNQRELEYDFIVAPGADPDRIRLAFDGAAITLDRSGELILRTSDGELRHRKPVIYQEVDGVRREVAGGYRLTGARQIAFELGAYDRTRPLIIDPILSFSTYLGGGADDFLQGIGVDGQGNVYLAGTTASADFPIVGGVGSPFAMTDVFVTKLDPSGSTLIYSTYLGGAGGDQARRLRVDETGNAYITGFTSSMDFPTTVGAADTSLSSQDAFVSKLDPTGSALVFSTFVGGNGNDTGYGIALDALGNVYLTGITNSNAQFATPGAFDVTYNGNSDVFIAKLDATGATLVYCTYLGTSGTDEAVGIAVDTAGNAYVTGLTTSSAFPTTPGAFDTTFGGGQDDGFVTKLNAAGTALVYSAFFGGPGVDLGEAIAVDGAGVATVAAQSGTYPGSSLQVMRINASGSVRTFLPVPAGSAQGLALAMDGLGNTYVAGSTQSASLATTPDAFDSSHNGEDDAILVKIDPAGTTVLYSTYLGGGGSDRGLGVAVDHAGNIYFGGYTTSGDFPTTANAFQTNNNGGYDSFIAKIDLVGARVTAATPSGTVTPTGRATVTFSEAIDAASFTAGDATLTGPGGPVAITSVNALSATEFEILFAVQSAPGAYTLAVGPDILDAVGNRMDQDQDQVNGEAGQDRFSAGFSILPSIPSLSLKVNGLDPNPPVVTTPGPVRLTLTIGPSSYTSPAAWYWALVFNGQLVWLTAGGVSPTPAPLTIAPPVAFTDLTLLNVNLPPGTVLTSVFFLVDASGLIASDAITATVTGP